MGRTKELLEERSSEPFFDLIPPHLRMPIFPCFGTMVLKGSPIMLGVYHVHEFPKKIAEALHMKEEEIDLEPIDKTNGSRIQQFKVLVILPNEPLEKPLELAVLDVIFPTSILI